MAVVTLQFVTEKGWQSALIRWLTWSDYSHVDFVLDDGRLLGARMDGGVQVRPANYAPFTIKQRYQADAPDSVLAYALSQVGKPYDSRGIINFGLHSRSWHDDKAWFCSELVAAAFDQAGVPLVLVPDNKRVTPRDLTLSLALRKI